MTETSTRADCGHVVLERGLLPGFVALPGRSRTLCYPCAEDVVRTTLADPRVHAYIARLNGSTIISPFNGRLAEVVVRVRGNQFVKPSDTLWIRDVNGRLWTSQVRREQRRGQLLLTSASDSRVPDHRPSADTVRPGDTIEAWESAHIVTSVSSDGVLAVTHVSSTESVTEFVPWAAMSRHTPRPCCIGPSNRCRCVNGVPECLQPGCNGRATALIDRLEYHDDEHIDTWEEKVCLEHYELLVTKHGWSTPKCGIAE